MLFFSGIDPVADLFTDDEGNKTWKNSTKNNDVINKTYKVTRNSMNTLPNYFLDEPIYMYITALHSELTHQKHLASNN